MPDAPENPTDDQARRDAFDDWWNSKPKEWNSKIAFEAGWRAAMAEVKKERDHLDQIVREERAEDVRWDRRNV